MLHALISSCCREVLYLEAVFELLTDEVEDDGVYAGVDCCKVHTKMIQDQQETEKYKTEEKAGYNYIFLLFLFAVRLVVLTQSTRGVLNELQYFQF